MNKLTFSHDGLRVNERLIKNTHRYEYEQIFKRIGKDRNVKIILTSEISLSGNVAGLDKMFAFRPAQNTIKSILENATFISSVWNFRLLGPLRRFTGKEVTQGVVPATLNAGDLLVLVYSNPEQESGLDFMVSYAEGLKGE